MRTRWACEYPGVDTFVSDSGQHPAVRIGDAERDECVEMLAEHHVRGRLSVEELDRRQRAALTALTEADLAALLVDLPGVATQSTRVDRPDGRSLGSRVRDARLVKWAAAPASLVAGGVLVASANPHNDETGFAVGFVAAALGFVANAVINKGSGKGP